MATLVVEDGTGVTSSNTYASSAEFDTYTTDRAITLSGSYTNAELLILAMDYIESLEYKGYKVLSTQSLQWPRTGVYIDSYYNDDDTIPDELKNAQMQTAVAIDAGNNPLQTIPRQTVREKVGEIEVQYSSGANSVVIDKKISYFLRKLLKSGTGGSGNIGVDKG